MTILPKKKHQSSKSDDGSHHGDAERGLQRGEEVRLSVPSPSCSWHQDSHPVDGPSHVKRRHRDSHARPQRPDESVQSNSSTASPSSSGGSSPIAGPSGFKPKKLSKLKRGKDTPKPVGNEEQPDALNSDDEYERLRDEALTEDEWAYREENFEELMKQKSWTMKQMEQDGACLFRAVADQVYGDQEMHSVVRTHCMDYVEKNADFFSQYITEGFDAYVSRKRLDYVHGNHVEIQAMSELYNRPIEVYSYSAEPFSTFKCEQKTDNPPIRLSYHRHVHYNSIVDPWAPTVGVGLGLPGYKPGLADKKLVSDALQQSEASALEQAMLEDKLKATDWEATDDAIEQQVARESYLQWLKDAQKRREGTSPQTSSSASSSSSSSPCQALLKAGRSPGGRHAGFPSPKPSTSYSHLSSPASRSPSMSGAGATGGPSTSKKKPREDRLGFQVDETASFLNNLPPEVFGLNDFEDHDTVLAQVLAASQEEYLNSLKKSKPDGECGEPPAKSDEHFDNQPGAVGDVHEDNRRPL